MGPYKTSKNTMIPTGFYIMDCSVKYMNARNPLEEGLIYSNEGWTRDWNLSFRYDTASSAIEKARILQAEAPVKVLQIQTNGNNIGVGEIQF